MRELGDADGPTPARRAARAATLDSDLATPSARSAPDGPRPNTALMFGREAGSPARHVRERRYRIPARHARDRGRTDAFDDIKRESLQVSVEMMLSRAPDVILEVHPSAEWTPAKLAAERDPWRALASVPAVRTNRIVELADDVMLVPGPRAADGVRMMAKAIH